MMAEDAKFTDAEASKVTRVEELAYELVIDQVMTKNLITLDPNETMLTVLDKFRLSRISGAPVVQGNQLLGILSIEDLIRSLRDGRVDRPVEDYMTKDVITVRDTDQVVEALKVFRKYQVGRLPVVNIKGNLTGMITKGDISDGLLAALQKDYENEEVIRYRASHLFEDINSDRTSLILRYSVKKDDFLHGGAASNNIKKALLRLGANPQIARKFGIAVYEAEMNLIIHTLHGGMIKVEVDPDKITMEAYDDGPGIENIDQAMEPGFSTASEEVRSKGFGAGMGLVNIRSCVNEMSLISSKKRGTNLFMVMNLPRTNHEGRAEVT
jgi:CBS domain-containing protein/anti-sigma regulatory factor (Ser/Thr protein kinase)